MTLRCSPPLLLQVYAATKRAVEPFIKAEVAAVNQALLDAVHAGNWAAYEVR